MSTHIFFPVDHKSPGCFNKKKYFENKLAKQNTTLYIENSLGYPTEAVYYFFTKSYSSSKFILS